MQIPSFCLLLVLTGQEANARAQAHARVLSHNTQHFVLREEAFPAPPSLVLEEDEEAPSGAAASRRGSATADLSSSSFGGVSLRTPSRGASLAAPSQRPPGVPLAASHDLLLLLISTSLLVCSLQVASGLLESGAVRFPGHTRSILWGRALGTLVCAASWWLIGITIAFPDASIEHLRSKDGAHEWVLQWVFSSVAASIVSAALAERVKREAFLVSCFVMTALIYPTVAHLRDSHFLAALSPDHAAFGGPGLAHLCGGVAALVGAIVVGPRAGRFTPGNAHAFAVHSSSLLALGTALTWLSWSGLAAATRRRGLPYGETSSASASLLGFSYDAAAPFLNMTLGAVSGLVMVLLVRPLACTQKKIGVGDLCNGFLAGLVSVMALDSARAEPHASAIVGALGGLCCILCRSGLVWACIDDPVNVISVHGACGLWGLLAAGLFDRSAGLIHTGCFAHLGSQALGIVAVFFWTATAATALFKALHAAQMLRVSGELATLGDRKKYFKFGAYILERSSRLSPRASTEPSLETTSPAGVHEAARAAAREAFVAEMRLPHLHPTCT